MCSARKCRINCWPEVVVSGSLGDGNAERTSANGVPAELWCRCLFKEKIHQPLTLGFGKESIDSTAVKQNKNNKKKTRLQCQGVVN